MLVEAFTTPEALNILSWAYDFANVNKPYLKVLSDYTAADEFVNNDCALALIETMNMPTIAASMSYFGILPFPCGPDMEYGEQLTYYSVIPAFALPENGKEPVYCEYILESLLEPLKGYETEESLRAMLENYLFFDDRDAAYYASMYSKTCYQYFATEGYQYMETMGVQFAKKSPSELIESLTGKLKSQIEEYIAPNYYYIKEHTAK